MTSAAAVPGLSLAAVRLSDVDLGLANTLADEERDMAGTFRSPSLRDRFLAGRIVLRLHVSALTGDSPASLKAEYFCPSCGNQGHGIPHYRAPSRTGPLRVSLSRAGRWCLAAASTDERIAGIGVDIEQQASADFAGFQSVALTANERARLQDLPQGLKAKFQTRLWVRKEAVLKALGTGLAMDPSLVDVSGSFPAILNGPSIRRLWNLQDISPSRAGLPENFATAVAAWQPVALGPHGQEEPVEATYLSGETSRQ